MSDQCKNCTVRGDLPACLVTPCLQHENWYAVEQQKIIEALKAENTRLTSTLNNMLNDYINLEIIDEWTLKAASDELKAAKQAEGLK